MKYPSSTSTSPFLVLVLLLLFFLSVAFVCVIITACVPAITVKVSACCPAMLWYNQHLTEGPTIMCTWELLLVSSILTLARFFVSRSSFSHVLDVWMESLFVAQFRELNLFGIWFYFVILKMISIYLFNATITYTGINALNPFQGKLLVEKECAFQKYSQELESKRRKNDRFSVVFLRFPALLTGSKAYNVISEYTAGL